MSLFLGWMAVGVWGGAAALAVGLLTALLGRLRAPGRLLALLWLAVGLRFLCPFGVRLSLPGQAGLPLAALAHAAVKATDAAALAVLPQDAAALPAAGAPGAAAAPGAEARAAAAPGATAGTDAAGPAPSLSAGASAEVPPSLARLLAAPPPGLPGAPALWQWLAAVWGAGVLFLSVRAGLALARLRRRVALACRTPDGCYTGAGIAVPFTLGLFRPRIYLPAALAGEQRIGVLLHERAHIRCRDTLTKPLFYLAAALHWWNPLAWLAFGQFSRQLEAACDEAATRGQSPARRAAYGAVLLQFAGAAAMPGALAFGQSDVRRRVGHLLRYRRPRRAALPLCGLLAALCLAACAARPTVSAAAGGGTASAAGPGPAPAAAQTAPQPTAGPGSAATAESAATAGSASLPAADAQPPVSLSAETLAALQESVAQYLADAAATGVPAARTADAPQASARTAPLEALANSAAALLPFRAGASFAPPLAAYSRISRSFQTGGHLGTDFAADAGTPVLAVQGGVVLLAQYNGSYGNCVIVYHGVGADGSPLVTLYAHLDSLAVTAGAPVAQGGQLGTVGATGNSTGPHLHLEVLAGGQRTDPQTLLFPPA